MSKLAGQVAMITGATSGMGAEAARRFVAEGARVVLTGRSHERGRALAAEIGVQARFIAMEAGDEDQIKAAVDFTVAEFDYEIGVLLGGVLFGIKHAVPVMKAQKSGSIINNASSAGHRAGHGPVLYSVAKAAVLHLTRVAALQLASHGIRVNSISPACIATPIFSIGTDLDYEQSVEALPIIERELAKIAPLQQAGKPKDIAATALFLASDDSRFITAQDIVVDGGLVAGYTTAESLEKFGGLHAALTAAYGDS